LFGDWVDFGGHEFTITAGSQPGWVTITYPGEPPWEANSETTFAAFDTELIVRKGQR